MWTVHRARDTVHRTPSRRSPTHSDQRWSTYLTQPVVTDRDFYFVATLDEHARHIVHHELLPEMDGLRLNRAPEQAIDTLRDPIAGSAAVTLVIQSDRVR